MIASLMGVSLMCLILLGQASVAHATLAIVTTQDAATQPPKNQTKATKATGLHLQHLHLIALHDGQRVTLNASPIITLPPQATAVVFIVPIPSAPMHYGVLEPDFSQDVSRFIRFVRHSSPPSQALPSKNIKPKFDKEKALPRTTMQKGTPIKVPDSQPITAKVDIVQSESFGPEAITWLEQWMSKQGLGKPTDFIEASTLEYYSKRKWSFVLVRYDIKRQDIKGQDTKSQDTKSQNTKSQNTKALSALQPFTISYKSERLVLPLKWPWSQTPFATRLDLIVRNSFRNTDYEQLAKAGWEVSASFGFPYLGPTPKTPTGINLVTLVPEQTPSRLRSAFRPWFKPKQTLHVRTLRLAAMEGKGHPKGWVEDWALPTPEGQQLMADTTPLKTLQDTQKTKRWKGLPPNSPKVPHSKLTAKPTDSPKKKPTSCASAVGGKPPTPPVLMGLLGLILYGVRKRRGRRDANA